MPEVAPGVRRNMQANKGRDTAPELAIRSALHSQGLRFRVNHPLPFNRRRRADITFTKVNLWVFVDGCFWHGCPKHFVEPKTRTEFWLAKVEANRARDEQTSEMLRESGATVLRFWEHDDPADVARKVASSYAALKKPR